MEEKMIDRIVIRYKEGKIDPFTRIWIVRDEKTGEIIPSTKDGETISYAIYVYNILSFMHEDPRRFIIEHKRKRGFIRKKIKKC